MHQPTLKLESVDASTDSWFTVCWCINRPMKNDLSYGLSTDCYDFKLIFVIFSRFLWMLMHQPTRVGWCINRLLFDSRLMHQPTPVLQSVDASTDSWTGVGWCINRLSIYSRLMHQPTHEKWIIIPTVHRLYMNLRVYESRVLTFVTRVLTFATRVLTFVQERPTELSSD